jgi:hypothetical protein
MAVDDGSSAGIKGSRAGGKTGAFRLKHGLLQLRGPEGLQKHKDKIIGMLDHLMGFAFEGLHSSQTLPLRLFCFQKQLVRTVVVFGGGRVKEDLPGFGLRETAIGGTTKARSTTSMLVLFALQNASNKANSNVKLYKPRHEAIAASTARFFS